MDVMIVATHGCSHYPNIVKELKALGVPHRVAFIEDEPELARRLGLRGSPNVVVDGKVVFRRQPTPEELREVLFGGSSPAGAGE